MLFKLVLFILVLFILVLFSYVTDGLRVLFRYYYTFILLYYSSLYGGSDKLLLLLLLFTFYYQCLYGYLSCNISIFKVIFILYSIMIVFVYLKTKLTNLFDPV